MGIANTPEKIAAMAADERLQQQVRDLLPSFVRYRYSYNFSWLGVPIIQLPVDVLAVQEIVWETKPEVIVETGVAHGGSLIFYASLLQLLGRGKVIGVDIDIRAHNRKVIEEHPLASRVELIEGSSTDPATLQQVQARLPEGASVMVVLDSNHTHEHVLQELERYSELVTKGNYLIVMDTNIEHTPAGVFVNRPWDKGNNPLTAVREFLKRTALFEIDATYTDKLLISACPDGFLRRTGG